MSDWIIDNSSTEEFKQPKSDWFIEPKSAPQQKENLSFSALMAIPRVSEDLYKGLAGLVNEIPEYASKAPAAIPEAMKTIAMHPLRAASQELAGFTELGKNTFNAPHDLANYFTNRLHLFPGDINKKIQMGRMPEDTQQLINQQFGVPKNQGEELIRGIPRNIINILGLKGAESIANPLRYRASSIAKEVVNTRNALVNKFGKRYTNIFNKADQNGLGVNLQNLIPHLDLDRAMMNEPLHAKTSVGEFINNPSTRTAHDAKKDLLKVQRKLIAKNERDSLTGGELDKLNALNDAIPKIESHMFTDAQGIEHPELTKEYRDTQSGYRTEVIPYTKNKAINAFRKGELRDKELVNSLNKGKFAAQRGDAHPRIGRRNAINKIAPWASVGLLGSAGLYGVNRLIEALRNNSPISNE